MTGQSIQNTDKYDNLKKGLSMKYKHFDDIEPSNKTDFIMLYFAACRSLRELESAIRRTNDGKLNCHQAWLLRRIQHKLSQNFLLFVVFLQ